MSDNALCPCGNLSHPFHYPAGPGKFEGEPSFAQCFYLRGLDGWASNTLYEDDHAVDVFTIDAEDAYCFPDLAPDIGKHLLLGEDDQGFVWTRIVDAAELASIESDLAADVAAEGEDA